MCIVLVVLCVPMLITLVGCVSIIDYEHDGIYYYIYPQKKYARVYAFSSDGSVESGQLQKCVVPSSVKYLGRTYSVKEIRSQKPLSMWGTNELMMNNAHIGELVVSETVTVIDIFDCEDIDTLAKITVNPDNEIYSSVDGVLFTKDKGELLYYPQGKEDTSFTLPKEFETFSNDSLFKENNKLQNVEIEDGSEIYKSIDGVLYSFDGTKLMFYSANKQDKFYMFPKEMREMDDDSYLWFNCYLQNISVDEENDHLKCEDNILYTIDGSELVFRPISCGTIFAIPSYVKVIGFSALMGVEYLYIPIGVETISSGFMIFDRKMLRPCSVEFVPHIYFENSELPDCVKNTHLDGELKFGVTRKQFEEIINNLENTNEN